LHFCDLFCIFAKDFAKLLYLGIKRILSFVLLSRFTVTLHLEKAVAASVLPKPKAQSFKSFGGRRKTFARPPQDIAPPAARLCHGRGKLVTLRFAPCYMPSKSL
jgi:hypothetical protein